MIRLCLLISFVLLVVSCCQGATIWEETFSTDPFASPQRWTRDNEHTWWNSSGWISNGTYHASTVTYASEFTTAEYTALNLSILYRITGLNGKITVWGRKDGSWINLHTIAATQWDDYTWYTFSKNLADGNWTKVSLVFNDSNFMGKDVANVKITGVLAAQPPSITSPPVSQTKLVGEAATFSITASGTPAPTYQWEIDTGSGWSPIDGATNSSYTIPVLVADDDGNSYRCTATNDHGSATSNAATLTVVLQEAEEPSLPTGVTASALCPTRVKIDWTAATDNVGVVGYKVYQNGNQVGVTTGTTFTDVYGNVSPSTTYSYTVSAYDAAGNDSGQSPPSVVTTGADPGTQTFDLGDCVNRISSSQQYTHTWNTTVTISDAKYHWLVRHKNLACPTCGQLMYMKGLGASDYYIGLPVPSGCISTTTSTNGYVPTPGVYSSFQAYFPYADVLAVDYVQLYRDSWYDRFAPMVMNLTSDLADGTYGVDQSVDVKVTFSEVVNVTGTPTLLLETGDTDRYAVYSSGSGSRTLVFVYTVQEEDSSDNLDYVGTNSLALNGGTIKDAGGNNAVLTLPAPGAPMSLGNNKNIGIYTAPPTDVIGEIKKRADGEAVNLAQKTVTAVFTDHLYIEEADRSSGIRVDPSIMPEELAAGDTVDVSGTIETNYNDERYISATSVKNIKEGEALGPVGMNSRALRGADTPEYKP